MAGMENNTTDELYLDSLRLSDVKLDSISPSNSKQSYLHNGDGSEIWLEEGYLCGDSGEERKDSSDLDREWERRRNQFHTIGYRDGLIAGKEVSAQEGFNLGFKETVLAGYDWGLVRGITSALACLPKGTKEKLVEDQGMQDKFQSLYETVRSVSSTDALKLFHEEIVARRRSTLLQSENTVSGSPALGLQDQTAICSVLGSHYGELLSLLEGSPAINAQFQRFYF